MRSRTHTHTHTHTSGRNIYSELNFGEQESLPILYEISIISVLCTLQLCNTFHIQVYGYARKFAKIGITDALVDSLHTGLSSPDLVSACITLKATAVNVSEVKSKSTSRKSVF